MYTIRESRVLGLFTISNNGRQLIRCGVGNVSNKTITNKHRFHLFIPGYKIGGCEFNGEMMRDINSNQISGSMNSGGSVDISGGNYRHYKKGMRDGRGSHKERD